MREKPRFPHDCDGCLFLGTYQGERRVSEVGEVCDVDLYYCPGVHDPTVLARYGYEPSNYMSCSVDCMGSSRNSPLIEALKKAKIRGLHVDK